MTGERAASIIAEVLNWLRWENHKDHLNLVFATDLLDLVGAALEHSQKQAFVKAIVAIEPRLDAENIMQIIKWAPENIKEEKEMAKNEKA